MRNLNHQIVETEIHSFGLISLFLKGFLSGKNINQNARICRWLKVLKQAGGEVRTRRVQLVRGVILEEALLSICGTLDRPLTESEILFLGVFVYEFTENYGLSFLKTV